MYYYNEYKFISRFAPYLPYWPYESTMLVFGNISDTK